MTRASGLKKNKRSPVADSQPPLWRARELSQGAESFAGPRQALRALSQRAHGSAGQGDAGLVEQPASAQRARRRRSLGVSKRLFQRDRAHSGEVRSAFRGSILVLLSPGLIVHWGVAKAAITGSARMSSSRSASPSPCLAQPSSPGIGSIGSGPWIASRWRRSLRSGSGRSASRLEADEATQACDTHWMTTELDGLGTSSNGVVIQWGSSASHDVDDAMTGVDAEMLCTGDILARESPAVAEPDGVGVMQKAQHGRISLRPIGHKQINILGRADVGMSDDGESADHDMRQTGRIRGCHYAGEIRPRGLALGQDPLCTRRRASRPPLARASGPPPSVVRPKARGCSRRVAPALRR